MENAIRPLAGEELKGEEDEVVVEDDDDEATESEAEHVTQEPVGCTRGRRDRPRPPCN
jgi:hypothetical protein